MPAPPAPPSASAPVVHAAREAKAVVVVGAGLAGLRTAERLRHRGYGHRITLLGAEGHLPYDRPPLSKRALHADAGPTWLRRDNDYSALDVDVHVGIAAHGLHVDRRVVLTERGEHRFDALVIATGAVPKRVPGIDGLVLRTFEDAARLRAQLRPGSDLAVIGAGLIGCEVAASARAVDVRVTLVDVAAAPLVRVLGTEVARTIALVHEEHGVTLRMGTTVVGVSPGHVHLDDGSDVAADVILEAVGATPDTGWLAASGLALDDGVVCDRLGCAAPGVYAVGDVARWAGRRGEHWTNAGHQADIVAAGILGQDPPLSDVPYWWSDQYDLKLQGLGSPAPTDDVHLLRWGPQSRTVALFSRDSILTGVVGFSAAKAVMTLRRDIAAGTPVARVLDRLEQ